MDYYACLNSVSLGLIIASDLKNNEKNMLILFLEAGLDTDLVDTCSRKRHCRYTSIF